MEVTAVAKAPNTTKSYDLTIASLNNKEGALEVNGKAAAIAGSDFGYDFKAPTVASVEGVDKNHVKVVFSEKVDKATAETTGNYDVTGLNGTSLGVISLAALQADGKSVLLTTAASMDTFANGYIAEVKTGVKDVKGNAVAALVKTIFSGVGTASTTGPVALSAVYTPATSGKIVIKFDKDINPTVDKTKITVGGAALALGDTAARTATAELTISLTAASKTAYDAAATKDVVFAEGAVKDTEATPNNIAATTITPVSAARLTSAAYDQATNILVLTFDKVVKIAGLDTTKITFNGQALDAIGTTANTVALKETSNSATLTLDLTKASKLAAIESAPAASRTLVFAGAFGTDINGNAVADATYTSVLTYTEDKTPPVVESITFNATTDTMVITVNEDVTIPKLAKVVVYDGTKKLFDFDSQKANISAASKGGAAIADGAATTNKKFTFFLKDGAGEAGALIKAPGINKQTLKVTFLKAGIAGDEALKDIAGNVYAKDADSSIAIAYTDQDPVTIASQVSQTGVSAKQVKVEFNKPLAVADIVASKFTVKKSDNAEVAVPVTAVTAFSNNTVVVLTMDSASPNYVNGYKYTVATTAKDIYGNPFAVPSPATIAQFTLDTTTTATAYKLTNAVYADANGDYTANAGDKITLTFDGAVSIQGDVTADDFALGGTGSPSLGSNFTIAAGTAPEQLVITLGTGASITLGTTTIDITGDPAKKHIVGANGVKVDAKGTAVTLMKPDTDGPKLASAKYYDANNNGAIDAGDTLEIVFNEGIKITAGPMEAKASGDTFVLSAGDLVLDGTKASVTDKTLLIEIKTASTAIVPGTTTINGAASANVKDLWDNNLQADAAKVIAKSDTTAPTFSNVRIVKGVGKTGAVLEETDKVIFDISEPVHIDFVKEAYVLYAGTTPIAYGKDNTALGFGGDGSGAAAGQVAIDNVAKTVTITIIDKDGWVGANIAALTTFNIDGFVKSFADANGNTMQPAAGFGHTITK